MLQESERPMRRVMHQVSVDQNDDGNVVLSQALNDPNEPDPEIVLSPDQVPLVAAWLVQTAEEVASDKGEGQEAIPVRYFARGPEAELESLSVYTNNSGMVILSIDDNTYIEVSPAMAKRLREQLSRAIRESLTDMLRPDAEA